MNTELISEKTELISEVTEVTVHINKTNPPQLVVRATGTASSGSHTNPKLERRIYVTFPADGIQEYDFQIIVPDGPGTTVTKEHTAENTWEDFPVDKLKGVKVYAKNNTLEEPVSGKGTDTLIKDLKAEVFNGTAGPLIRVTCDANAGDFPDAVTLTERQPQGTVENELFLDLNNAVDSNAPNWKPLTFTKNLKSASQYNKVSVFFQNNIVSSASVPKQS
jgi:hypothetical protein